MATAALQPHRTWGSIPFGSVARAAVASQTDSSGAIRTAPIPTAAANTPSTRGPALYTSSTKTTVNWVTGLPKNATSMATPMLTTSPVRLRR